jgi:hypothetical protein
MRSFTKFLMGALVLFACQAAIHGQVTGSISGTIVDQTGAVVPGVTVTVKGESGQNYTVTTNDAGYYNIAGVPAGASTYTVTATAPNFKTAITRNVKVDIGTPATVNVALEAGKIDEVVVITSGAEVLQTETATVGATITGRQIQETPISSRDALDLILRLPGVNSVGAPRQSSINGLPKGAIQMSLDGVDNQDNVLRSSDGFFTFVRPRVDAIDEVTVSTSNPGAESSGDGAVQVKFVTKRGTNRYTGSLYSQVRNTWLNSAYWYTNRDKPNGVDADGKARRDDIKLFQPGVAIGGPIPFLKFGEGTDGWFDSGKDDRFFFVNYEQFRLPGTQSRQRRVLQPGAETGLYRYVAGDGTTRSVNLLNLAPAGLDCDVSTAGVQPCATTVDPRVSATLAQIAAATASTGSFSSISATELNQRFFNFSNPANGYREFLALRFDFNITKNHSFEYVQNRQTFHPSIDVINGADMNFPGGTSFGQGGIRKTWTGALRSTITKNIVNEVRYARGGGGTEFNQGAGGSLYASQGGFNLGGFGIPNLTALNQAAANNTSYRTTPTIDWTDNLTWLKGNHSFSFGGSHKLVYNDSTATAAFVPTVGFGWSTTEASIYNAIFNTTTLPGASDAQIAEARAYYAGLTGRVVSYTNSAVLTADGQYTLNANQATGLRQQNYGLYAQDSWRIRPNLTLTYGLRWQPQLGVENTTKNQSRLVDYDTLWDVSGPNNIFKPGTLTGVRPSNRLLEVGEKIMPDDWNNLAPSFGFVWSPDFGEKGILGRLMGSSGKTVFRGGFSSSFVREGLNVASQIIVGPGGTTPVNRASTIANSITFGTLLRTPNNPNLTPFNFNPSPAFPILLTTASNSFAPAPDFRTGMVNSFSFGLQRELDKNTVVEVRYEGNRGKDLQRLTGLNQRNLIENGVAAEFKAAQANLYANIAANRCQGTLTPATTPNCQYNFAYFGPGTGTSPLPIALAYFNGTPATLTPGSSGQIGSVTGAGSLVTGNYGSALFRDLSTFSGLNQVAASVANYATGLDGVAARRANAVTAGLPSNFMVVSPNTAGPFLLDNSVSSWYDSMVIEVRRRLSAGLRVQASYVFAKAQSDFFGVSSTANVSIGNRAESKGLSKTVQPFDIRHSFKLDSTYDLPFGRGRYLFSNAGGFMQALVGGFSLQPVFTLSSGAPIQLGNVQLVGMTVKDLQKAVKIRYTESQVMWLPDDIIQNTQRAFDTGLSSTATGGYNSTFGTGGPTGRYIAPAGIGNCQDLIGGTCGFNNLVIYGPRFMKFDLGITKRVGLGERRSFQITANVLNAFNEPNFRFGGAGANTAATGFGGTFGQMGTGSAYRDNNTTNDPGGRVIDLLLRFNF